jgi:hypothetical protein
VKQSDDREKSKKVFRNKTKKSKLATKQVDKPAETFGPNEKEVCEEDNDKPATKPANKPAVKQSDDREKSKKSKLATKPVDKPAETVGPNEKEVCEPKKKPGDKLKKLPKTRKNNQVALDADDAMARAIEILKELQDTDMDDILSPSDFSEI